MDMKITAITSDVVYGETQNAGERRSSKYFFGDAVPQKMSGQGEW